MFVYSSSARLSGAAIRTTLRSACIAIQAEAGTGHFHSFYRLFPAPAGPRGLACPECRAADLGTLIGEVPISTAAFCPARVGRRPTHPRHPGRGLRRLFAFFDTYDWHLDDRPLKSGNEINPDVLGYIFEKVHQPEADGGLLHEGDITEYISKNTRHPPHLLEQARAGCKVAFEGESSVWRAARGRP